MNLKKYILLRFNKKIFSLLIIMFLTLSFAKSQQDTSNCEFTRFMANDLYQQSIEMYETHPRRSFQLLEEAVEADPGFTKAYFRMGKVKFNEALKAIDNLVPGKKIDELFEASIDNFHTVVRLDSSFNNYLANYYLGKYYYTLSKYQLTKKYLELFINNNNTDCNQVKEAEEMLENVYYYFKLIQNPVDFNPKILYGVCTENDEYLPFISPNGEYIFYTRAFKNSPNYTSKLKEIFYYSKRLNPNEEVEKYSSGKMMTYPFNQDGRDEGGVTITIDNKHLFITICQYERTKYTSYKNCDIYKSDMVNGKWSPLEKLGPNINGNGTWEGQPSITADGKVLFFSSAREGGMGGTDIYRSVKDEQGNWGPAENLGPIINTPGEDKTPFIHSDSQTLYFASNGHFGLGGYDIFYSHYLGSGRWSKPKNIGYPINTQEDDLGFIISTNGEKIYFASDNYTGKGGWDIYSSELYEEARPKKVLFVEGKLSEPKTQLPDFSTASVEVQNVRTLKINKGLVDPHTGEFAVAIAVPEENDEFMVTVKKEGAFFISKMIKPDKKDLSNPPKTVNFELQPIEVGTIIKLDNIYFDFNSADFDDRSIVSLNNFKEFLELNPTLKISLYGHTDNIGSEESNMILSWQRAKAVRDYLVEQGINHERITYRGFGESKPIATNATKKGRQLNRRTEFVVKIK